ncbi:terminase [Gulosibacter macacae]|uniref:Terminase n=1 Tax=Gulosibacter macacae TaxID=2488791 RepID=A0A3P3VSY5_9MICO|nr:terminase family protein [Gulosibacter macacae]RRJ85912.1 terminase [Gulosibacter macacae]
MGVVHDDWQRGLGRAVLAKREKGLYAAGVGGVVLSTCRQVGKTFTFGTIIFALCILQPRRIALWTAHHSKTSDETFESLASLAKRPQIAPYVEKIRLGNGQQAIIFKNGSRILFGAREHGFGRGIPGVSIVVFDEAQILKQSALNDMIPAANTIKNPLILFMGTPPDPKDPSEVFKGYRKKALAVKEARANGEVVESNQLYIEIGADHGADLDDREQWKRGNPSYPDRTPEESILRLRELLGDEASFAREGLGIWDEEIRAGSRAIPAPAWKATAVSTSPPEGVRSIAITFSRDGQKQSVAGVVKHDEATHLELVGNYLGPVEEGVEPLAKWLAERWRDLAMIAICGQAGAASLVQALLEEKVPQHFIHVLSAAEYLASGPLLLTAISGRKVTHPAAPEDDVLEKSVAVSDKEFRGKTGGWAWRATTDDGDETPVEAIGVALWASQNTKRIPRAKRTRRVIVRS